MQEMEDRLIELEAMQKVLLEGVGQSNSICTDDGRLSTTLAITVSN
jgi:hypothetical protein